METKRVVDRSPPHRSITRRSWEHACGNLCQMRIMTSGGAEGLIWKRSPPSPWRLPICRWAALSTRTGLI